MPEQDQSQGLGFLPQGGLENLAYSFASQPQTNNQPPTVNIGGHNILDVTKQTAGNRIGGYLQDTATQFIRQRQMQKGQQFLKSVHDVMSANLLPEDRINKLLELKAQHGTDYGLGLDNIIQVSSEQAKRGQLNKLLKIDENGNTKLPDGFEIIGYDQKGQPMIRKTKADVPLMKFEADKQEKQAQLEAKSQMVRDSALDTLNTIGEVEKGINNFGVFGNVPSIPGTDRANWEANINKLLSTNIINLIMSMKDASKNGATGFGALSERELDVLKGASTALNKGLSAKDAKKYIEQMKNMARKVVSNKASQTQVNTQQAQPTQSSNDFSYLWE